MFIKPLQFAGIYPIKWDGENKLPYPLTPEDRHLIVTQVANSLETLGIIKPESFPVSCPQDMIDLFVNARKSGCAFGVRQPELSDTFVRSGSKEADFVNFEVDLQDLPTDWFLFVDEDKNNKQDAKFARGLAESLQYRNEEIMAAAINADQEIETDKPINVTIHQWREKEQLDSRAKRPPSPNVELEIAFDGQRALYTSPPSEVKRLAFT